MLTDSRIRSARRSTSPRKISDGGGLHLLVAPNGGRYWRYSYRFNGKQKTLALGIYPDVSLAKVRERHQKARELLADGIDPAQEKQKAAPTFEDAARAWHAHWAQGASKRYGDYVLRRLEADIFPELGARPLSGLQPSAFRDAVRKIEQRGALDIAKRALEKCGQIMRYAVTNDLAERNPVAEIKPADVLKPRKRRNYPRVTPKEVPELLHSMDNYIGAEHTRLALQLMALTFVRTSELIGALWSEFDIPAARWEIPAERMKMKNPHIVPLSKQALAVLEKLRAIAFDRELVFPGDIDPTKPMSNNTLLYALYRMGYRGRMTGHGFRGVASTVLHEQDWPHEHIELQLAHQPEDETSAAYNHALYLKPRAKMMQWWADHLDELRRQNEKQADKLAA